MKVTLGGHSSTSNIEFKSSTQRGERKKNKSKKKKKKKAGSHARQKERPAQYLLWLLLHQRC